MLFAIRLIGRDKVGDIAVDEELTLIGPEDRGHMHAAVAAGDYHRARALPLSGQSAVPCLVLGIAGRLPPLIALQQIRRQSLGLVHV